MPFSSVRSDNGLLWAAMRPARFARPIHAILIALLVLGAWGCSTKESRILGNERLLRGPDGLGTTTRESLIPDRDTYVSPGAANFGPTLLIGSQGGFDSRAFFRVPSWAIPDTTLPSFAVTAIFLEVPFDTFVTTPLNLLVDLATTATAYDTLASFPGPAPDQTLGTVDAGVVLPFRVPIATSVFTQIKGWAQNPSSLPGLVLYAAGGSGITGLQAGKAVLKIRYDHLVSGATVSDSTSTAIPLDFTLHTPGTPAPTGTDTTLVLGGLYEWSVPLHFAAAAVASGSTVNEATLRLRVVPGSPTYPTSRTVDLEVRRIRNAWLESAGSVAPLGADSTVLVARTQLAITGPADSVVTVTLPQSLLRAWTAAGGINEGLLLTLKNGNILPEILLLSRESTSPIELRVSITTPPPGRF